MRVTHQISTNADFGLILKALRVKEAPKRKKKGKKKVKPKSTLRGFERRGILRVRSKTLADQKKTRKSLDQWATIHGGETSWEGPVGAAKSEDLMVGVKAF